MKKNTSPYIAAALYLATAALVFAQSNYEPYYFSTFAGKAPGYADGTGSAARFSSPQGVGVDNAGNVYVADFTNDVIRKIAAGGVVTTIAGAPENAGSADGVGTAARFNAPSDVTVDSSGVLYVADNGNNTIRKIATDGTVSTFAGTPGVAGSSDGTGGAAQFNSPSYLAFDSSGNLFVADGGNNTIRKITPAGAVTTVAGSAGTAGSTDGNGSVARFKSPQGLGFDSAGNLFVVDAGNDTVRKITPAGDVTTFAGSPGAAGIADGTGSAARFNLPVGLAIDGSDNVYVSAANNGTIRKITSAGVVTTFAGTANSQGSVDGAGSAARFNLPNGLRSDSGGNIYVADTGNNLIRQVTSAAAVTTVAGTADSATTVDGPRSAARFKFPQGMAVDGSNNAYVMDSLDSVVRKIAADGTTSTLAGLAGVAGSADGVGSAARFANPRHLASDGAGNVYVGDTFNHTIRKVTPDGTVTTLAGLAGSPGNTDGTGNAARFRQPRGVAVDGSGNVYVADSNNATIRKVTAAGVVTTIAGLAGTVGSTDGNGSNARFNFPICVAVDNAGNVYVTDNGNSTVRKITPAGDVTTLAGTAGVHGFNDGVGAAAQFGDLNGVAVDTAGNLYVADDQAQTIRKITPLGLVTTVAGAPNVPGSRDGAGSVAHFDSPRGVAVDSNGRLYVADNSNHTVRVGTRLAPSPDTATFTSIGFMPGDNFSEVRSVTADGLVVVGSSAVSTAGSLTSRKPVLWTPGSGFEVLPNPPADGTAESSTSSLTASDVSPDGAWIAYRAQPGGTGRREAMLGFSDGTQGTALGRVAATKPTSANQITNDGSVVFGFGNDSNNVTHAFRWSSASGIQALSEPSGYSTALTAGRGVSADGSVSVGSLTAADQTDQAYVWTSSGGMQAIGFLPGGTNSDALAVSADGSMVFGTSTSSNVPGAGPFTGELFLWTQSAGMQSLGHPAGYDEYSNFAGMSADGALIVINSEDSTGQNPNTVMICQTATKTFFTLRDAMVGAGIDPGWTALGAAGMSDDGNSVFGSGTDPNGNTQGFVIRFPANYLRSYASPKQNVLGVLSTRGAVLNGDNVLISGFIITGSSPKKVLIRGLGQSVAVPNTLADPTLDLHDGSGTLIASNDNWKDPQEAEIAATGRAPLFASESAVIRTLVPGNYTAILQGKNGSTGIGEVEVVDLDPAASSHVANIASRLFVGTGDSALVGGFTVNGPQYEKVLLRAIAPSTGVAGALQDPTLLLRDSNGRTVVFNNNWKDTQQADIEATGIPPSDDRESAIVATLAPGSYTAVVTGACDTTGVAVGEMYDLGPNGSTSQIPASSGDPVCATPSPSPTATPTASPTVTATPTPRPSTTPTPTATPTVTPVPTPVPTPTPTATPSATPTATPVATATPTPTPVPNNPPAVVLTTTDNGGLTPPNGTQLTIGQSFTMSATASDDHAVASVAFLIDGAIVGRSATPPYQLKVTPLAAGDHTLSARATDDQGASTDSNTVTITLTPPSGATFTFVGSAGGDWSNPANWSPQGVPGAADLAELKNGQTVSVAGASVSVGSLTVSGNSAIIGNGSLTVTSSFTFGGGSLSALHIAIPLGAHWTLAGTDPKGLTDVTVDNAGITTCNGAGAVSGNAATVFNNTGNFTILSSSGGTATGVTFGQFNNAGYVQIKGTLTTNTYTQSAGELDLGGYLDDGTVAAGLAVLQGSPITLNGGTMTGSGTIVGDLVNNGGSIVIGHSAGVLKVNGNYTQGAKGSLALEIGGTESNQYDQLLVSGAATLDGTLTVRTINNFIPDPATSFAPLQFSSVTGDFAKTSSNADVAVSASGIEVNVTGPNPPAPQARNISTRLSVQSGENVLIGGFIITGPAGTTKNIAVRGIGPSLSHFGITDALPDPLLELHRPDGSVLVNDNWKDAANASSVVPELVPSDDLESVVLTELSAGGYTAIVRDAHDQTGVGLAEVYDLDSPSATQLANISTRGLVQTGDDVLIGGFIIGGSEPAKVLVRAIGPSLADKGVQIPLLDPTLEVHDINGAVISNDDWRNTQEALVNATTIPPSDDRESAILATLAPGHYTAIVRGKNDTKGVALVEVFMLQ